jgi:hypothetical protein
LRARELDFVKSTRSGSFSSFTTTSAIVVEVNSWFENVLARVKSIRQTGLSSETIELLRFSRQRGADRVLRSVESSTRLRVTLFDDVL